MLAAGESARKFDQKLEKRATKPSASAAITYFQTINGESILHSKVDTSAQYVLCISS